MSLGAKLSFAFAGLIAAAGLAGWMVYSSAQQAFDQVDQQRTKAVLAHLHQLLAVRKAELHQQIDQAANSEVILKILASPGNASFTAEAAAKQAEAYRFDFLELVGDDGSIISCPHWPARIGSKNAWVAQSGDWQQQEPFLRYVEDPKGTQLGLLAVRMIITGERQFWVIGGKKLGQEFLAGLAVPAGMRVLLYLNPDSSSRTNAPMSAFGPVESASPLESLVREVRRQGKESARTIVWSGRSTDAERVHAQPLLGRENDLLAVVLLCNSQRELASVTGMISNLGLVASLLVLPLGFFARGWAKRRLTRPLQRLDEGFRQVGAGNRSFRVRIRSSDEMGQLGHAFDRMARNLAVQSDKLKQAERVAAWRELTQQLALHLHSPLSSMQGAVERLTHPTEQNSEHLDKVREDLATLVSQLTSLQAMLRCLNEFSSMPPPRLQLVDINELLCRLLQELDPQLRAAATPIRPEVLLERDVPKVMADSELLQSVLQGLVLNALDALPEGGVLKVHTQRTKNGAALISISDNGRGWSREEMKELFVDGNLTEPEGAGWGIAIVQAVVSDIDGHVSVESSPGKGTQVRIELPKAGSSS